MDVMCSPGEVLMVVDLCLWNMSLDIWMGEMEQESFPSCRGDSPEMKQIPKVTRNIGDSRSCLMSSASAASLVCEKYSVPAMLRSLGQCPVPCVL